MRANMLSTWLSDMEALLCGLCRMQSSYGLHLRHREENTSLVPESQEAEALTTTWERQNEP